MPPLAAKPKGFWDELRTAWQRGRQVWRLVSVRDKWALRGAGLVMAVVAVCTALNKKLLGGLVDLVPAMQGDADQGSFFAAVGLYLAGIAGLFVLAEALQVVRKYVVQNT